MILEEFFDERIQLPIQLIVCVQGCKVLADDALEDKLTYVRERLIVVIFANGKVDVPTGYEAVHHTNEYLNVFVYLLVHVVVFQWLAL